MYSISGSSLRSFISWRETRRAVRLFLELISFNFPSFARPLALLAPISFLYLTMRLTLSSSPGDGVGEPVGGGGAVVQRLLDRAQSGAGHLRADGLGLLVRAGGAVD